MILEEFVGAIRSAFCHGTGLEFFGCDGSITVGVQFLEHLFGITFWFVGLAGRRFFICGQSKAGREREGRENCGEQFHSCVVFFVVLAAGVAAVVIVKRAPWTRVAGDHSMDDSLSSG